MSNQNPADTAPLLCGGIYTREDPVFGTIEAMVIGVRQRTKDKRREGFLHIPGFMPELVVEGTQGFHGWALVARPTRLRKPVTSLVEDKE